MKTVPMLLMVSALTSNAAVISFNISPAGSDVAVGLSPSNEVPPSASTGSGGNISLGTAYDSSTGTMTVSLGYGSAAGFTDLTGVPTGMGIYGPAQTNQNASLLINLNPYNFPAHNPTNGGVIFGGIAYPTNLVAGLLAGSNYINIATSANTNGEIRGQLIPVDMPPILVCPGPQTVEQTSTNGASANVSVSVEDPLGLQLTVVWTVNGVAVQTNSVPVTQPPAASMVTLLTTFPPGTNTVAAVAINTAGSTACSTTVAVVDTTPPSLTCPNIVTTNDSGQCTAVVYFTPTATDASGIASLSSDTASGSTFSTGTNTVTVTAVDNAGLTNTCTFTVTVLDTEAPLVGCVAAPNPSGKVFEPGKNASAGSNPNGYYQLRAKDNCDAESALLIYVYDTGSGFVAGPFHSGNIVRVQHGSTPSSAPGSAPIVAVLRLVQDGLVYAQDTSGNVTPGANRCLLPVSIK